MIKTFKTKCEDQQSFFFQVSNYLKTHLTLEHLVGYFTSEGGNKDNRRSVKLSHTNIILNDFFFNNNNNNNNSRLDLNLHLWTRLIILQIIKTCLKILLIDFSVIKYKSLSLEEASG